MAKLYYQYGSRHQPILLRDAPNPRQLNHFQSLKTITFNLLQLLIFSLSSALAGAFSVIARNLDYLRSIKIVNEKVERSESAEINRLYKEALEDFVKLPFAVVAGNCGNFVIFEN